LAWPRQVNRIDRVHLIVTSAIWAAGFSGLGHPTVG